MPDIAAWLGSRETDVTHEALWASSAWLRIQDKPTTVTFRKPNGTTLAAQTVRLELSDSSRDADSAAGTQQVKQVVIFGVKGHDTVTDTDVRSGYRFVHNGQEYQVRDVTPAMGEVQARAEVVG